MQKPVSTLDNWVLLLINLIRTRRQRLGWYLGRYPGTGMFSYRA
jgi:hypothetical protein